MQNKREMAQYTYKTFDPTRLTSLPADINDSEVNNITLQPVFTEIIEQINEINGNTGNNRRRALNIENYAELLMYLYKPVTFYQKNHPENKTIGFYAEEEGLYLTDQQTVEHLIQRIAPNNLFYRRSVKPILDVLIANTPQVYCSIEDNLIPVNNGVIDAHLGQPPVITPYSSEHYFDSKLMTDYKPTPVDKRIEKFFTLITENKNQYDLLWGILAGVFNVATQKDKGIWLCDTDDNGKTARSLVNIIECIAGKDICTRFVSLHYGHRGDVKKLRNAHINIDSHIYRDVKIDKIKNYINTLTNKPIKGKFDYGGIMDFDFIGTNIHVLPERTTPNCRDKNHPVVKRSIILRFTEPIDAGTLNDFLDYIKSTPSAREYILYKALNTPWEEIFTFDED